MVRIVWVCSYSSEMDDTQRHEAAQTFKKQLRDARNEIKDLKVENNALKRQERLSVIQTRAVEDAQKKANRLAKYSIVDIVTKWIIGFVLAANLAAKTKPMIHFVT